MTITYANGIKVEGIVLARTEVWMRVALRGCRDSVEFSAGPEGTWLSEWGELAFIGTHSPQAATSEVLDDFLCPQDLVTRLVGNAAPAPVLALA